MEFFGKKPETVMGWSFAPPRLTLWAYLYALVYLAAPFLLVMALLDGVLYLVFTEIFDSCYAVFCLFGDTGSPSGG